MRGWLVLLCAAPCVAAQSSVDGKALFEKKCSVCHASETEERRIGPSLKALKDGRLPDAIGKMATREKYSEAD